MTEEMDVKTFRNLKKRAPRTRRKRADGFRSQDERDFAMFLGVLRSRDTIITYKYECMRLLAISTATRDRWYTPDFVTCDVQGKIVVYEVKGGYARDKDMQRFEAASERWGDAMQFVLVKRSKSESCGWEFTEY